MKQMKLWDDNLCQYYLKVSENDIFYIIEYNCRLLIKQRKEVFEDICRLATRWLRMVNPSQRTTLTSPMVTSAICRQSNRYGQESNPRYLTLKAHMYTTVQYRCSTVVNVWALRVIHLGFDFHPYQLLYTRYRRSNGCPLLYGYIAMYNTVAAQQPTYKSVLLQFGYSAAMVLYIAI